MVEGFKPLLKRQYQKSLVRYVLLLVVTFVLLSLGVSILDTYNVKALLEDRGLHLTVFFSWEVAIIMQTLVSFYSFSNDDETERILPAKVKRLSSNFIWTCLLIAMALYTYFSYTVTEDTFLRIILSDSITFVPMLVFFLFNLGFLLRYCRDEQKRKYFGKLIIFLDLPFLIPYSVVVWFSYNNRDHIDVRTFIAGAAAMLLLSSNFATFAFKSFKIEYEEPRTGSA